MGDLVSRVGSSGLGLEGAELLLEARHDTAEVGLRLRFRLHHRLVLGRADDGTSGVGTLGASSLAVARVLRTAWALSLYFSYSSRRASSSAWQRRWLSGAVGEARPRSPAPSS